VVHGLSLAALTDACHGKVQLWRLAKQQPCTVQERVTINTE